MFFLSPSWGLEHSVLDFPDSGLQPHQHYGISVAQLLVDMVTVDFLQYSDYGVRFIKHTEQPRILFEMVILMDAFIIQ